MGQKKNESEGFRNAQTFGTFDKTSFACGEIRTSPLPDRASLTSQYKGDDSEGIVVDQRKSYVLLTILLATNFFAALDGTITTTLAVPLLKTFEEPSILSWLGSAYFIGCACIQPICGRFCDRYGSRLGLTVALYIFAVGNTLVAIAPCSFVLLFGRSLSGVGGGAMGTVASIIVSDYVSLDRRGFWQGVINIAFGFGHGSGGPLGGCLDTIVGWRFAFLIQAFATCGLLTACSGLPEACRGSESQNAAETKPSPNDDPVPLDIKGAAMITAAIVALLYAVNHAVFSDSAWMNTNSTICALFAVALVGFFIRGSIRNPGTSILPLRSLGNTSVLSSCLCSALISAGFTGVEFFLPIFLQLQTGSIAISGLRLSFLSLGGMLGSFGIGCLTMSHARISLIPLAILVFGTIGVEMSGATTSWPAVDLAAACCAFGFAGSLTSLLCELLLASQPEELPINTSLNYAFRHVGAALGVAASASAFRIKLIHELEGTFTGSSIPSMEQALAALTEQARLPREVLIPIMESVGRSLHDAFGVSLVCCGLALVTYFAFRLGCLCRRIRGLNLNHGPVNKPQDIGRS